MNPMSSAILLVRFRDDAGPETCSALAGRLGVDRCRWHGSRLLCVQIEESSREGMLAELRGTAGVRDVLTAPDFPGPSAVRLPNGAVIGDGSLSVIAGPCSVESAAQLCEIAASVREAGAAALRGGAFKARTSPYSFGGLGEKGLECLALAREKTGLPVVTEVLDAQDLDLVARFADVLQIGSRNMQNTPLLFQAGSHASGKPVILKRGFAATIEEFLQAAQYVLLGRLSAGRREPGLILCERGIRTPCDATRFTLDVGAIAVLQTRTDLPVIADPSHAAGDRRYVAPLARAAAAAGADGLLVEVHPDPAQAWSDGPQCLDLRAFAQLMKGLRIERSEQPCL